MSILKNKAFWVVSGTISTLYFVPKLVGNKSNVFETPGTKQIGDRWSAGGGATTHTPATATKRGDPSDNDPSADNKARGGMDTQQYKDNIISQRPGEPGPFDKSWNSAHYGHEKGK